MSFIWRHHNQTNHFHHRVRATAFPTLTFFFFSCADSNAVPVNYIQAIGRHHRLISELRWLVQMLSGIKVIRISAVLIALEPLLISFLLVCSVSKYSYFGDEAAETDAGRGLGSGSTHAAGMSNARKLVTPLFISFPCFVLESCAAGSLHSWLVTSSLHGDRNDHQNSKSHQRPIKNGQLH